MAGFTIPNDVSGGTTEQHAQASPDSVDFTILAAAQNQTGVLSGCAVTAQGTPNMTVAVAAGLVQVAGATVPVTTGNGTITAANATNPRFDLVTINSSGTITVVAGTAAATPVFPTTSNAVLAAVYVAANATSIANGDIVDKRMLLASPGYGWGVYGDGSDGTVTFDGTTTILGMAPSSNTYTLTRDLFLAAGTINSGVIINLAGYRLFCAGTLTNNGNINCNGSAGGNGTASGGTGGALVGNVYMGPGNNGGNGGTTTGSAGNFNSSTGLGGNGGAGGAGSSAGASGGTNVMASFNVLPRSLPQALTIASSKLNTVYTGGAGGGGGGGDGTNGGGGGGGGGAPIVVCARAFSGTGAIQSRGGNGGAGRNIGNTGGGGGGGGGVVVVVSGSVAGGAITGQTIDANAGTGGAKNGTGVAGSNGTAGLVILIPN